MRSPENETFEPKYVKFSDFLNCSPLMENVGATCDNALMLYVFVALITRPAQR